MFPSCIDPELGQISFVVNPRSRRILLRLVADGVRVTLPSEQFYEDAVQFLEKSRPVLLSKKGKHQQTIDPDHSLHTFAFDVHVVPSVRSQVFFRLSGRELVIEYPQQKDVLLPAMQAAFRKGIVYFMRQAAKKTLPLMLKNLAVRHGFKYASVKIQSSQTRWGSCSGSNSINLSFYLMLLPEHLIEYVLLHELCHTVEHNHSSRFWALLEKVAPDSDNLKKELGHYHIRHLF